MPEGPSILILKDEAMQFRGQKVLEVTGNSKMDIQRMKGKKVIDIKTWGKHFLVCFKGFTLRIHLMLFGSYRINDIREGRSPRLSLHFKSGQINFYACSVKFLEGDINEYYDWSADVLSDAWNADSARQKLLKLPEMLACDALLDQNIFAGVGNIIKNEALWRIRLHPLSRIGALPEPELNALIFEARNYSFDFLRWKRKYELRKHYQVHTKKMCPRDEVPLILKHLGKTNRRTFYCEVCQVLYS